MQGIHRDGDNELCGYVRERNGVWESLTVFSAVLARHATREDAVDHVTRVGLAVLSEVWEHRAEGSDEWQPVRILEAGPAGVTIALGYYSLPGVPTVSFPTALVDASGCLRPLQRS